MLMFCGWSTHEPKNDILTVGFRACDLYSTDHWYLVKIRKMLHEILAEWFITDINKSTPYASA